MTDLYMDEAIVAACPQCGEPIGKPCRTMSAKAKIKRQPHTTRELAAYAVYLKMPAQGRHAR